MIRKQDELKAQTPGTFEHEIRNKFLSFLLKVECVLRKNYRLLKGEIIRALKEKLSEILHMKKKEKEKLAVPSETKKTQNEIDRVEKEIDKAK